MIFSVYLHRDEAPTTRSRLREKEPGGLRQRIPLRRNISLKFNTEILSRNK
jgi:hypothetical protein